MNKPVFTVESFEDCFLIIRSEKKENLSLLARSIFEQKIAFVDEVIGSEKEILIKVNQKYKPEDSKRLLNFNFSHLPAPKSFKLPICFNGKDWDYICKHLNKSKEIIIGEIAGNTLNVTMFGFLPGFLYLNHNLKWEIPRKPNPEKKMSAGTFALGGQYAGIYALESPGGWHSIGNTPISLYSSSGLPPIPVHPGEKLIIEQISQSDFDRLKREDLSLVEYNLRLS